MTDRFVYKDETDKCYGIAGMVISLRILDDDITLKHVSLDDADSVAFTPDFFFCSNPRFSARIAWNEMIKQYQIMVGMAVGNLLCRAYANQRTDLRGQTIDVLHDVLAEDGRDYCQLGDDEIDTIFTKTLSYLDNVYKSRNVISLADRFADSVRRMRTLTGSEVRDLLQSLR